MVTRVAERPGFTSVERPRAVFPTEKVVRIALYVISVLAGIGTIFMGAHVIAGRLSFFPFGIGALSLAYFSKIAGSAAKNIVDLNDPKELKELKAKFCGKSMTEMLKAYPLETILKYDLVSLSLLRTRCCVDLLGRRYEPRPILMKHADDLLKYRIINPLIHQALVRDDVEELLRCTPRNAHELSEIFPERQ